MKNVYLFLVLSMFFSPLQGQTYKSVIKSFIFDKDSPTIDLKTASDGLMIGFAALPAESSLTGSYSFKSGSKSKTVKVLYELSKASDEVFTFAMLASSPGSFPLELPFNIRKKMSSVSISYELTSIIPSETLELVLICTKSGDRGVEVKNFDLLLD